jgi:predicted nucleic acid-binding protein
MTGFVVDASVAIKWLVDEPLSAQAARLLDDDLPLAAPELIYAEAASALWAIARRAGSALPMSAKRSICWPTRP